MHNDQIDFIAFKFLKYATQFAENIKTIGELETEEEIDKLNETLKNDVDILCDLKKELIREN